MIGLAFTLIALNALFITLVVREQNKINRMIFDDIKITKTKCASTAKPHLKK